MSRIKVLLLTDWFEPAYKAGGPVRSCVNLVNSLSKDYDFFVLTSAYDLNDRDPLKSIEINKWLQKDSFQVFYSSSLTLIRFRSILKQIKPDVIYINSFFSFRFSIMPLIFLKAIKYCGKIVLCPRGMLRSSARIFKKKKKDLFLSLGKFIGLYSHVVFHATDDQERLDIQSCFGSAIIVKALNFTSASNISKTNIEKVPGRLDLLSIGRIHPINGIDLLLESLKSIKGSVTLTLLGKIEDNDYWEICKKIIDSLPQNIKVVYVGEVPYSDIQPYYSKCHFYVSPTKGENYGHSIVDALKNGRPVIISDQTPWRNLKEKNAGFDLPNDILSFYQVIQHVINWDHEKYIEYANGAFMFGQSISDNNNIKSIYKAIFDVN